MSLSISKSTRSAYKRPKKSLLPTLLTCPTLNDSKLHSIHSKFLWSFDSPRKDAKKQARLRGVKFFYALEVKLCQNEYKYLKCLRSDKPCCKYLILKLEKPDLKIKQFPERKHHLKEFKLVINSKTHLRLQTKFWTQIAPKITSLDYVSNEIANFRQLITKSRASKYRNLKNVSFPIIRQLDNSFYPQVFNFLKNLHSLRILSFNVVSTLKQDATIQTLNDLTQLYQLKSLDINIKANDPACFEILSQTLDKFQELKVLCLQFGKISGKNVQELLLKNALKIASQLSTISHLDLELYLNSSYKALFEQFLCGLENMNNLISLNLLIDRHKSSFQEILVFPNTSQSILSKTKYLNLEGAKVGMGLDLAKYFLSKMKNLRVCCLKNVELGGKVGSEDEMEDMGSYLLENKELKELKLVYQKEFVAKPLENLFRNIGKFDKLQLFSLQLHNQETLSLDLECLVNMIRSLGNTDTIVIEILFPIKIKGSLLNRLFENFTKLKRLSAIKLDLRLAEEVKGSSLKKLFQMGNLDIITLLIEGMKLSKDDQIYIKEVSKKLKKMTSCLIECEEFKFDKKF